MQFPDSFFEDEVRDGFFVPGLMKRAWAAQMEILADVDKVCKKYNIRWFADRGTLLGAVRHKGYIPWDDDLDICMLRDDYIRFFAVAEKELPSNYYIPKEREADHRMLTTIFNSNTMPSDKEHLKKYHEFPLCAAIDVFVLDYVAPDPEDEEFRIKLAGIAITVALAMDDENRSPEEIETMVQQVEDLLQVSINREEPLQEQMFVLIEHLFSLYTAQEATEVACMPNWVGFHGWKFPLECYREAVRIPFECTEIAVPQGYLEAVRIQFGENYMQPYRAGGGHAYPSYMKVEEMLTESPSTTANLLSQYYFSPEDLERPVWKGGGTRPGTVAGKFVQVLANIHSQLGLTLKTGDYATAASLLEAAQESAIQIGTMLEQFLGEGFVTVKLLEEYCEQLYQIHGAIAGSLPDSGAEAGAAFRTELDAEAAGEVLDRHLERIGDSVRKDICNRKEVVFLPFRASAWKSLEPAWKAAVADPDCDVYVIPIPYYYKTMTAESVTLHYEGNDFPDYVPVTEFSAYNFEARMPDVIVIHNPYDNCSFATSVHPAFYSGNLQKYTEKLVYIPYFQVDEIAPDDTRSIHNMRYYVSVPGVVRADRVLVQSEQMRRSYIDYLTQFAGENTKPVWEEKIRVSPFR